MGRRWKEDGDQVQLGVQMAHAICAAGEPALADSPSLGSALGTFSTLPRALGTGARCLFLLPIPARV